MVAHLDRFLGLRQLVLEAQQGTTMLQWDPSGPSPRGALHLRLFHLDDDVTTLTTAKVDAQHGGPAAASVPLAEIDDVMAGVDAVTLFGRPANDVEAAVRARSFQIVLQHGARLELVAPTPRDFAVWYHGLRFVLGFGAVVEADGVLAARQEEDGAEEGKEEDEEDEEDELDTAQLRAQLDQMTQVVEALLEERKLLIRTSEVKDQKISLLQKARENLGGQPDADAAAREYQLGRQWQQVQDELRLKKHHIDRLRRHNAELQETVAVKNATIQELSAFVRELSASSS